MFNLNKCVLQSTFHLRITCHFHIFLHFFVLCKANVSVNKVELILMLATTNDKF